MDILKLYAQFLKGVDYFNREYRSGGKNPVVRRQSEDFERMVVRPFDEACLKLSAAERQELENQI